MSQRVSLSEVVLASSLKCARVAFRQQVPIGPYAVDFFVEPDFVVECEGIVHSHRQKSDEYRTSRLEVMGYSVWRISNYTVFKDSSGIAKMLKEAQLYVLKRMTIPEHPQLSGPRSNCGMLLSWDGWQHEHYKWN